MKVHQAGHRSVVALMGAVLYEPQRFALLERFRRATLLLDGDPTGRKASAVIAQRLRLHCSVRVVPLSDGVQPDQLTEDEIRNILAPFANDD